MHQPMTNLEAWRFYLKDIISPDSFIDMGFYYLISAALQRRVYLGSDELPLFPNQYITFVGPAAVGKGLVLTRVAQFLSHHKLRPNMKVQGTTKPEEKSLDPTANQAFMRELELQNPELFKKANGHAMMKRYEEPLAIPVAADCNTFEGLVRAQAMSLRSGHYTSTSTLLKNGMYSHSSLCFCLEEISSLFQKQKENVARYLIRAYDCQDYNYHTKSDERADRVLSPCLNFLGGTQHSFMQEMFKDRLLTEGLASRTIYISEQEPRFHRYDMFTFNSAQLLAKQQIIEHLGKLITLFGNVRQTPEAYAFMKSYVEETLAKRANRPNQSAKLDSYYGRKRIHIEKMAMAIHFADSTEFTIGIESYEKAVSILDNIEKTMDDALNIGGRNPLASLGDKIMNYLKLHPEGKSNIEIWQEHFDHVKDERELTDLLNYLMRIGKVDFNEKVTASGRTIHKYKLKT